MKKGKQKKETGNLNRRHFLYCVNLIALSLLAIAAVCVAGVFVLRGRESDKKAQELQAQLDELAGEEKTLYTQEELEEELKEAREEGAQSERSRLLMEIQSDMESGTSTASMLRSLFSDDIVVVSGGKYYFYPVLESVALNSYESGDFELGEDGRLKYTGSGEVRLQTGLDISESDGEVDWTAVAEDDIAFVMVRAGERLTSDNADAQTLAGDLVLDSAFEENVTGAYDAGLSVGVFWNLGAVSAEEAQEEAQELVGLLADQSSRITGPVAVRLNVPAETDRTTGQGRADWTEWIKLFCQTVEEAGYTPMIYGTLAGFVMMLDMEELEEYGYLRWISNTGASLYFPYEFSLWQYSVTGAVQGISTEVSLNALLSSG